MACSLQAVAGSRDFSNRRAIVKDWIHQLNGKPVQKFLMSISSRTTPPKLQKFRSDQKSSAKDCKEINKELKCNQTTQICPEDESPEHLEIAPGKKEVRQMVIESAMLQFLDNDIHPLLITDAGPKIYPNAGFFNMHKQLMMALQFRVELRKQMDDACKESSVVKTTNMDEGISLSPQKHPRYHTDRARQLIMEFVERPIPNIAEILFVKENVMEDDTGVLYMEESKKQTTLETEANAV